MIAVLHTLTSMLMLTSSLSTLTTNLIAVLRRRPTRWLEVTAPTHVASSATARCEAPQASDGRAEH